MYMARPIRNTPILMGKDAERFLSEIYSVPSYEDRMKERARVEASAQQLLGLIQDIKGMIS